MTYWLKCKSAIVFYSFDLWTEVGFFFFALIWFVCFFPLQKENVSSDGDWMVLHSNRKLQVPRELIPFPCALSTLLFTLCPGCVLMCITSSSSYRFQQVDISRCWESTKMLFVPLIVMSTSESKDTLFLLNIASQFSRCWDLLLLFLEERQALRHALATYPRLDSNSESFCLSHLCARHVPLHWALDVCIFYLLSF